LIIWLFDYLERKLYIKLVKKMAQYEHLPVFKTAYDLMIEIYVRTKDFPKEYKYTI
jgi:GTP cyclohydrolase III